MKIELKQKPITENKINTIKKRIWGLDEALELMLTLFKPSPVLSKSYLVDNI